MIFKIGKDAIKIPNKSITYGQLEDFTKLVDMKNGEFDIEDMKNIIENKPIETMDFISELTDKNSSYFWGKSITEIAQILIEFSSFVAMLINDDSETTSSKNEVCSQPQDTLIYDDLFDLSMTIYNTIKINPIELRSKSASEVFEFVKRLNKRDLLNKKENRNAKDENIVRRPATTWF